MAYDISFNILIVFLISAFAVGIFGVVRKIPLFAVVAGILMLTFFVAVDNIELTDAIGNTTSTTTLPTVLKAQQSITTGSITQQSGGNLRLAEFVNGASSPLNGLEVSTISVNLKKTGTPLSLGTVSIQDSTAGTHVKVFGSFNTTNISTVFAWYNFSLPEGEFYTLNSTNRITVEYSGTASIQTSCSQLNTFPISKCQFATATTWSDCTSNLDMAFRLYDVSDTLLYETKSNEFAKQDLRFETNEGAQIKLFFLIFGISFMFIGAIEQKYGI